MLLHWWYFLLFFFFVNQTDANLDSHPAWQKLPRKECGKTRVDKRIVGGEEAALGQFPWMSRIGFKRGFSNVFLCGASLISTRYLITAAHCFLEKIEMRNYFVRLGEHNFRTVVDCEGCTCAPIPQDIPLSKISVHENHNEENDFNDIALVEMRSDAILHEFVQPICMPQGEIQDPKYIHEGQGIVAGWGLINSSDISSSSRVLMYVPMEFTETENCVNLYNRSGKPVRTDNSQLCVGMPTGKSSCLGDSGGPLMKRFRLQDETIRYFLLGVVSYGLGKCSAGPAIYTNVGFYLEWILDKLELF